MSADVGTSGSLAECAADLSAPHPTTSWHQWAERISAAWQKAIEPIIHTGRLLIQAKADLPHGVFEAMVQSKLPFTPSTARRLMAIARHPVISDRAHVHVLPPAWGTLYELAKLPPPLLKAKINDGSITPKLERKDVAKLRSGELIVDGKVVTATNRKSRLARLEEENRRLRQREDGDTWNPKTSSPREIATAMIGQLEAYRGKAEKVFRIGLAILDDRRNRHLHRAPGTEAV